MHSASAEEVERLAAAAAGGQLDGGQTLVSLMETSNSNLVDKLASQNKRARSPDRKPEEPKLLSKTLELRDDAHSILQKEY